jgi:protein-S-isoprenylcysteine O-methyltransferase
MKKIGSTLVVLLIFYALPLAGNLPLLVHWKILLLMFACVLIWATQPAITLQDSAAQKSNDRLTVWLILGLALPTVAMPVMEWAYWQNPELRNALDLPHFVGLILLVVGLALRILAIRTLDSFFTATVQIKDDHQLVTKGVYGILRHPSYSGAYLCYLGSALWLGAFWGLVLAAVLMGIAYFYRIEAEERTLEGAFGEAYKHYREKTWRMLPGIW